MESNPFSRKSWASQSLRITAKELSLVSGRGKSTAIAERFSKYQKAAEESSADKKKGSLESGTAPLRSGNLSVLKKRWEQARTRDQDNPPSVPAPGRSISRSRPHTFTRPPSVGEPPVKSPDPVTDRGGRHTASRVHQASAVPEGEDQRGMEKDEMTHNSANEKLEQQVPTSPRASYEKPRVPLNNLKMKFEKGEEPMGKGGRAVLRSTSSEDMDQHGSLAVSDRVLESKSSLKEKLAKYQSAVTKQEPLHSVLAPQTSAPKESASVNEKVTPVPECNGDGTEQPKALRKFRSAERETCFTCTKTVYPLERLVAHQHVYHKSCFCCIHCNTRLSIGNYASLHGNIYCKAHFNQLFKAKGNYDEGFGHRPHKEMWEPRNDGDEDAEVVKPKEQEKTATVTSPAEHTSDIQPETSPSVKVTDLMALLETRTQKNASSDEKYQSEKPAEKRKLRIDWPPRTGERQSGTELLSPVSEGITSSRPWRAKWPPDDEAHSTFRSSERTELKNLRRSTSLKERSRPFTIAAKPSSPTTVGPREPRRPLKSLQEWRASFEEKKSSEEPTEENKPEVQQVTKQMSSATSSEEEAASRPGKKKERVEQVIKGNTTGDKVAVDVGSLRSRSDDVPVNLSPPLQPKQNRTSQDVGFWEEDKEGSDAEELSAEDIIKKNRCYEEEEEDDDDTES